MDEDFWTALDKLINESEIVIDRPKGSKHPKYNLVYALDYGYLKGTTSQDGQGIDVWRGTLNNQGVDAIICTIDLLKRDSEIKLLLNCTEDEKKTILDFHNNSDYMRGILIRR